MSLFGAQTPSLSFTQLPLRVEVPGGEVDVAVPVSLDLIPDSGGVVPVSLSAVFSHQRHFKGCPCGLSLDLTIIARP